MTLNPFKWEEPTRAKAYRIALATIALAAVVGKAVGYNIDNDVLEGVSTWVAIILGFSATGLAVNNTSLSSSS